MLSWKTLHTLWSPEMAAHSTVSCVGENTGFSNMTQYILLAFCTGKPRLADYWKWTGTKSRYCKDTWQRLFHQHFTIKCWPFKDHSSVFKTHRRSHYISCYKNSFEINYGFKTIAYCLQNKSCKSILKTQTLAILPTIVYTMRDTMKRGKTTFLNKLRLNLANSLKRNFPDFSFKTEQQTWTRIAMRLDYLFIFKILSAKLDTVVVKGRSIPPVITLPLCQLYLYSHAVS